LVGGASELELKEEKTVPWADREAATDRWRRSLQGLFRSNDEEWWTTSGSFLGDRYEWSVPDREDTNPSYIKS